MTDADELESLRKMPYIGEWTKLNRFKAWFLSNHYKDDCYCDLCKEVRVEGN